MHVLERAFERMGARVAFAELARRNRFSGRVVAGDLALDVREDRRGEYFLISRDPFSQTELVVLDVQPKDRHLLLLSRGTEGKHRYLLGHDERHWFVAGIPENTAVSRVRDAKQALKPDLVQKSELGIRMKDRDRRSNNARVRQGEWFFVPSPQVRLEKLLVFRNEPISRGMGGKPHMCEELYRFGGETVYVSPGAQNGLTEDQYQRLSDSERSRWQWRVMRRNPRVYVRGRVRHPDHKTVTLDGWHEVLSNTENLSHAMRNIAFLD
ncbi:MAG TPA: hypothetical protein VN682_16170 [Terriglobales bacterium]|nr:hypothetical protein [Terriglobales bacterium]